MSGDAHDLSNIETCAVIKFSYPLQVKAPKEIHSILTETFGEHAVIGISGSNPERARGDKSQWL
jgi:hypothetical protein